MDITKTNDTLKTNKFFNGETINYFAAYSAVTLIFLVIKQFLKTIFSLQADISVLISFIISCVILFILEKKFVFKEKSYYKSIKQILFALLRCFVDVGFFCIVNFLFSNILKMQSAFVYTLLWFIYLFFNFSFDKLIVFNSSTDQKQSTGKLYKLFFSNRYVFVSMAVALFAISIVYLSYRLFPFGDTTVMRMDLYHQYGPLFGEFYDRIVEHKSFLYSWESGGGSSFLGNYFNYLSSPLSFLIFLFDRKELAFAITTLVVIKGVLSAGTFTYFIKNSLNSHSFASAAFGVLYAFSGYFLAYYWNIMWIDGMILLPLIALGIEKIINNSKPILYICSLTLLLFSSYYMGYMACIFSILYFLLYFISNKSFKDTVSDVDTKNKKYSLKKLYSNAFINKGIKFTVSSLLCGALCACTLIPVYFILQACSATSDSFPETFESYFNLIDMLSSHFAGLETTIRSSGDDVLPNIYCGILPLLLVPLYVANKKIRLKEKAIYILMIIFFAFSFNNNIMNFIWHAFHFPNDLPYRFSFMYCFIFLIMAYKALMNIKAINQQVLAFSGIIMALVVMFFQKNPTTKFTDATVYISLAFIIIWTGVLILIKRKTVSKFLTGIIIISMVLCEVIIADVNSYVFTQDQSDYVQDYDNYEDAIDYIEKNDESFYRTELCYLNTRMDPCLYGYNGMSTFSSMAYEDYSQNQYSLGMFGNRINSYTYNTQTPVYNMMYGLKYLIYNNQGAVPSTDYYSEIYSVKNSDTKVYENKYNLPVAFETSDQIKKWDNQEGNPFEVQEDFIDKAAGVNNVFIPVDYIETNCDMIDCDDVNENGTYYFSKTESDGDYGTVDVTIKTVKDGNVYVYVTSPLVTDVNYYWNNDEDSEFQNIDEPFIKDLGYHKKGDEITISINCGNIESEGSMFEIYAYNVDNDVFKAAYDILNAGALNIESFSETGIKGTIHAGYDGFLYTSIPFDKGWKVYIDGKEVKTFDIGDCQLAAALPQGEHKIEFKYSPKGQKIGFAISAAAWLLIIIYFVFRKNKSKIIDKFGKVE